MKINKIDNIYKVLKLIINYKSISRAELSRKLCLNKSTVSYLISSLENKNIIKSKTKLKETKGRYSVLYELNKNYATVISINIMHNNIYFYVTNLHSELIYSDVIKIELKNIQSFEDCLIKQIEYLLKNFNNNLGIGIGIHGTITNEQIINFIPANKISNFDLKKILEDKFSNQNFYIQNEANITALGESQIINKKTALTISNSKGIGLGIIIDGSIYKGSDGFAGELGHMIVEPNGLNCSCGNRGCLEMYASEENIIIQAKKVSSMNVDKFTFVKLFEEGNEKIKNIYYKSIDYFLIAVSNSIMLLNPSVIILNGFLFSKIPNTIDYINKNLNNKFYNLNIVTLSSLEKQAFYIGYTNFIIDDYFLQEVFWNL